MAAGRALDRAYSHDGGAQPCLRTLRPPRRPGLPQAGSLPLVANANDVAVGVGVMAPIWRAFSSVIGASLLFGTFEQKSGPISALRRLCECCELRSAGAAFRVCLLFQQKGARDLQPLAHSLAWGSGITWPGQRLVVPPHFVGSLSASGNAMGASIARPPRRLRGFDLSAHSACGDPNSFHREKHMGGPKLLSFKSKV